MASASSRACSGAEAPRLRTCSMSMPLVESAYAEDFAAGFKMERDEIGALIGSPNQVESVTAFFEKRPPNYAEVDGD